MRNPALGKDEFERLFRKHFKGLCLFAVRYVRDIEIARELVQDAFLSLWEKRETINPEQSVSGYLSATVRNKCLNHIRDHKKMEGRIVPSDQALAELSFVPYDTLVEREVLAEIENAIGELPGKCREIFMLNRFENLRYQEIADRLSISVKTVETQMSKALQHMRLRLGKYLVTLILILMNII